jgi:hypothetical protein
MVQTKEGKRGIQSMFKVPLRAFCLAVCLLSVAACSSAPPKTSGLPAPQNLLGSTDELQLVTELSLNLASQYGGSHVLVVLEIDGTLLSMKAGQDIDPCNPAALESHAGKMQLSQADAADQVRRLQAAGLKVIVLTRRGPDCLQQTFAELSDNGFNFSATAWPPADGYPGPFLPEGGDRPVVYERGVFFTDGQNKGLMLKALLDKTPDPRPVLIVMADQSQESLNAVMKEFSFSSTKVHAWRYTREAGVSAGP